MGFEDGVISDSEPESPLVESSSEEDDLNILNNRAVRRKRRIRGITRENVKRPREVDDPFRADFVERVSGIELKVSRN